ncbi:RDD family protein [Streptosporangium sp. NPDC051023]|uniref:RDD family protein n=1 Tax=Streptosporangium sp. NPDC051023 TaxID=3155410 RepID=UPI00344FB8B6
MPQFSRLSRSALSAWGVAALVAVLPTWELWRERLDFEEFTRTYGGSDQVYGYVCLFDSGSTLSPLAPLRHDLEVVKELTTEWAVPALVVLLGLVACLGRRDPRVIGRRVAGLVVMIALIDPLASLYSDRGICGETVPLFSADWFTGVAGGWGITQLFLLTAAALVLGASRAMRPVTSSEPSESRAEMMPDESRTGMIWRRPAAALADYLIVVSVFSAVVGLARLLIGIGFMIGMGAGLLRRADVYVFQSDVKLAGLAILAGLFAYFWVQHVVWGRTLGKRLLGVRVIVARTGGRLGAGKAALRTLIFPLFVLVPGVGLWCLLVDGLWTLLDPEGRVLRDRLLGAAVVRDRVKHAQPQI